MANWGPRPPDHPRIRHLTARQKCQSVTIQPCDRPGDYESLVSLTPRYRPLLGLPGSGGCHRRTPRARVSAAAHGQSGSPGSIDLSIQLDQARHHSRWSAAYQNSSRDRARHLPKLDWQGTRAGSESGDEHGCAQSLCRPSDQAGTGRPPGKGAPATGWYRRRSAGRDTLIRNGDIRQRQSVTSRFPLSVKARPELDRTEARPPRWHPGAGFCRRPRRAGPPPVPSHHDCRSECGSTPDSVAPER